MDKVNIENLTYKKPTLFEDLNQLLGVHKGEIVIDPTPDASPTPTPGDNSTGTGGQ